MSYHVGHTPNLYGLYAVTVSRLEWCFYLAAPGAHGSGLLNYLVAQSGGVHGAPDSWPWPSVAGEPYAGVLGVCALTLVNPRDVSLDGSYMVFRVNSVVRNEILRNASGTPVVAGMPWGNYPDRYWDVPPGVVADYIGAYIYSDDDGNPFVDPGGVLQH